MDDTDKALTTGEHSALREEILFLIKQSYANESAVVLGSAALYAWASTNPAASLVRFIWWLPVLLAVLGGLREIGIRIRVAQIGGYLRVIEDGLRTDETLGWEHYLADIRKKTKGNILGITSGIFWCVLIVTTIVVASCFSV